MYDSIIYRKECGYFMLFFKKKETEYTGRTTGTITGVSAVQVNNRHLPLVDYYVDSVKYTIRMPYKMAVEMEKASQNEGGIVRANRNFGTSFSGQYTKLIGAAVPVCYDPKKPKNAKIG